MHKKCLQQAVQGMAQASEKAPDFEYHASDLTKFGAKIRDNEFFI